ncbi:MAG: gamma-glutamyltransferase [Actinomycetia bacterium]|nr:gamma-glutamyltransferase [Actinomycetes bacterium]
MTRVSVASPLRLATETGLDAGRRGGNAIDAALATAAVLTVAYPASCAIGGDLLALVREPDGRTTFIDASGRAPIATDVEAVRSRHREIPIHGPLPVTVPGVVGGWSALAAHGAALPWRELLAPAQAAAADGTPVSAGLAGSIMATVPFLGSFPDLASLLCPEGTPLTEGQALRQPALARTLGVIADGGPAVLYDGELGAALCAGLAERGVPMTRADLRDFHVDEAAPLQINADGWLVQAGRPSSQAYLVLRLLGMLDTVDVGNADTPLHRRLPADRLGRAFVQLSEERDAILADARFMTQSVDDLLTPAALQQLAHSVLVDDGARGAASEPSTHPDGDTVAVVAADDEGRSVSLIQSLFHGFGSLILEPRTGILMHDRGACFVLDPHSPNVLAPGKRPLHTLAPVLAQSVEAPDTHRLVVGTMGGHVQPQILTQVLSHLMAGEGAQDAVGAPRFTVGAWQADDPAAMLNVESDIDPRVLHELEAYSGPRTMLTSHDSRVGHAHAIRVTGSGSDTSFDTGSDPRADG